MQIIWTGLLQLSSDIPLQMTTVSSTREAEKINHLVNYFYLAAAFILFIVVALTTYILIRYRRSRQPQPGSGNLSQRWEWLITGIPLLLVVLFFILSMRTHSAIAPPSPAGKPDAIITGHQWWWQVDYPAAQVTSANEIHLPAGKNLLLQIESADVIHSWWLPQFGSKMDAIPGEKNFLSVHINEPGKYYGICSEYCGDQHAHMQIIIVCETDSAYNNWLSTQQHASVANIESAGARLFNEKSCSSCHRINGTTADGTSGPDLTHLASRNTLLQGLLVNNHDNLMKWIRDPQGIKPGCYMPDFALADSSVEMIVSYLSSLK